MSAIKEGAPTTPLSRRDVLKLLGFGSLGSILAACKVYKKPEMDQLESILGSKGLARVRLENPETSPYYKLFIPKPNSPLSTEVALRLFTEIGMDTGSYPVTLARCGEILTPIKACDGSSFDEWTNEGVREDYVSHITTNETPILGIRVDSENHGVLLLKPQTSHIEALLAKERKKFHDPDEVYWPSVLFAEFTPSDFPCQNLTAEADREQNGLTVLNWLFKSYHENQHFKPNFTVIHPDLLPDYRRMLSSNDWSFNTLKEAWDKNGQNREHLNVAALLKSQGNFPFKESTSPQPFKLYPEDFEHNPKLTQVPIGTLVTLRSMVMAQKNLAVAVVGVNANESARLLMPPENPDPEALSWSEIHRNDHIVLPAQYLAPLIF